MVNRERMVGEFMELVKIDSLTRCERKMADTLKSKLEGMGLTVFEDDAGARIGGNAGNLICTVKGSRDTDPILLMAHMDTAVPGTGKNPVIQGNYIRSDGTTILGGDDLAGVECILEALRVLKEDGIEHGDIQAVFTIAEEGGLFGAKNMDYSKIYAKYGFVMDSGGSIGTVAVRAPAQNKIDVVVKGKAAHAGIEPERGVSAVQIMSEAVANMRLGRVDEETTANIGVISGGQATNIICDRVEVKAEARSRDRAKLDRQTEHMKQCFEKAAEKYGGAVEFESELCYPEFNIREEDEIVSILKRAAQDAGVELVLEATGGGSDTNIINGRGIQAVDLSIGMDKVHTVEEQINIDDLTKSAEFLVAIIKAV
ncbi:MAG: M20/M25/M40 family metallo-hydrolase [Clostridiales bacterium]|jgi:tripeptide aminopeptidase|nr:M20/M25/M40 family metallo-hydrolase [Eubacteriales bacterium]MDH7567265.1 M20/M25/M40 family metallo-hydrolase [Clostridiales bacterium]